MVTVGGRAIAERGIPAGTPRFIDVLAAGPDGEERWVREALFDDPGSPAGCMTLGGSRT